MDQAITKRQLGIVALAVSVLALLGIVALDVFRLSAQRGVGPAQKLAIVGCIVGVVLALPLIIWGRAVPAARASEPLAPDVPHETRRSVLTTRRVLCGIALAMMIGYLIIFVIYSLSLASFPFDYDQGEGFELNDTVLLSQGQLPYRDNAIYPFYASNYPPLYHVLLIPFVWLFGPQYWYGRLAGALAALIAAGAIGFAVYRETRHRPIALLSGLAFIASNYVYHIGPLFRQHMTMVMFETLAIVILARLGAAHSKDQSKNQRRTLIVGLVFLLAAGYTKQLAIATAAAAFLYLFLRRPRRAIGWGVVFAAVAGVIFAALQVATAGQWWTNIITANVNQYIMSQFIGLLKQFIGLHGALLLLALAFAAYELYCDRLSLYTIWFVAAGVDAVLSGKWGAGDSYFVTMIAAMCILAGLFAARSANRLWRLPPALVSRFTSPPAPLSARRAGELVGKVEGERSVRRADNEVNSLAPLLSLAACALFIVYGYAVFHLPLDGPILGPVAQLMHVSTNTKFPNFYDSAGWTMGYATIGQIPTADDVANGWRILAAAKAAGGDPANGGKPFLSEEAAFSFRAGWPVVSNPTQLLNLYQNGHYDPSSLVKLIDDRAFGAVIFRARFYPQPVLDAVDANYKLQETIPMNGYDYMVLAPAK